MRFFKYHALGNDYLLMPVDPALITPTLARRVCHRNYGLGSDGILVPLPAPSGSPFPSPFFAVQIINSDGSQAEKSGNGLRIFSRWLYDQGMVHHSPFAIWTAGGWVQARVAPGGSPITIDMGQASFDSTHIPLPGPVRQVVNEPLQVNGDTLRICAVTLGNPHCVVLDAPCDAETACRLGPHIENHPAFPNRTNVQFLAVNDRANITIQIWERGAGYTLASGSSACAAAAAAHRLGMVDARVNVHCPGGDLQVEISPHYDLRLTGPVTRVADGEYTPE